MSISDFQHAGAGLPDPFRLLVKETVESTNDEVGALARAGAAAGIVVIAGTQTAGRGRRGASWFSPPGESLAFSILVRPQEPKSLWPRLALAAGLAVAEALEQHGLDAGIKWPNDVWIGGKKAAGILVEAGADFAIVGIGLNVNTVEFPPEVAAIATSMRVESGMTFDRGEVLASIIRKFASRRLQIGSGFTELLAGIRVRCTLTGKLVSLSTATGQRTGTVEGIADGGELLLLTDQGLERLIQADEVRVLGN